MRLTLGMNRLAESIAPRGSGFDFSATRISPPAGAGGHEALLVGAAMICWYGLVYCLIRPLTGAPVGDSWVYEHAVVHFNRTGEIQFAGFTQALPVAQVLYGALWSRIFGATSPSLDLSTAVLGMIGGLLLYYLARRCGAGVGSASAAAALLVCNPCYLFLSFSFMTEVPFIAALLASYLAFAHATAGSRKWLWLAGFAAAVGFAIRPFTVTAIGGEAAALFIRGRKEREKRLARLANLTPLIVALIVCAGFWLWIIVLNPEPWMFKYQMHRLRSGFWLVPLRTYLVRGFLAPAIYLGAVLSPLAAVHAVARWGSRLAMGIVTLTGIAVLLTHGSVTDLTSITCFGGSCSALVLNGQPLHRLPAWLAWSMLVIGVIGFAGICSAVCEVVRSGDRVVIALLSGTVMYWLLMPCLWFFSDRYDLVTVPAAGLILALARPERWQASMATAGMTIVLAFVSVAGTASYHCSMQQVVNQTEILLRQGIPRRQIDAGYSLNGRDLYVYPVGGQTEHEPSIPLVIGSSILPYVIATSRMPNTAIWREFSGCGPLGFGDRPLFVLKSEHQ
jgi:hypothetical protein